MADVDRYVLRLDRAGKARHSFGPSFRRHRLRLAEQDQLDIGVPRQNLTGDASQEYFSDGLTEETITDLGELNPDQLGVIARTSSTAYKRTDKTIAQIGHELGV